MMWPRLRSIFELMRQGGVIFISIDDNECASLKQIMAEIFGEDSFLGTIIWKNATDNNPTNIATEHEYIHAFAKDKGLVAPEWKSPLSEIREIVSEKGRELLESHKSIDAAQEEFKAWIIEHRDQLGPLKEYDRLDERGVFTASRSVHNPGREGYRWDLENPLTGRLVPQPLRGYRFPEETRDQLIKEDRIIFSDDPDNLIRLRLDLSEYREKMPSLIELDGRRGAKELGSIFPDRTQPFKNPKTYTLIEWLISFCTTENSIILDSFAGSGTTAHAVLSLNQKDGGRRRFVLVEGENYADDLTAERVRRLLTGGSEGSREGVRKYDDTLTYCSLGESLELDRILTGESLPPWSTMGEVLYHMASAKPFDAKTADEDSGYLGRDGDRRFWLIYKDDLDFLKSADAALTLSRAEEFAATTEGDPNACHVVFASARFVSEKLLGERRIPVEFAPLPFALYRIARS